MFISSLEQLIVFIKFLYFYILLRIAFEFAERMKKMRNDIQMYDYLLSKYKIRERVEKDR